MRNWRISTRLVSLLALPVVAATTLGALRIQSSLDNVHQLEDVKALTDVTEHATSLAGALQNERDVSAGPLSAGKSPKTKSVADARKSTDNAEKAYEASTEHLSVGTLHGSGASLVAIGQQLQNLAAIRQDAYDHDDYISTTVSSYDSLIQSLLSLSEDLAEATGNEEMISQARSLATFSAAKNYDSIQRAVIDAGIARGRKFNSNDYRYLEQAFRSEETSQRQFKQVYGAGSDDLLSELAAGTAVDTVDSGEASFAGTPKGIQQAPATYQAWDDQARQKIQAMSQVEQTLLKQMQQKAQSLQDEAQRDALINGLLILLVLGVAVVGAFVVARSMVRSLRRLQDTAQEVAQKRLPELVKQLSESDPQDVDTSVELIGINSRDEIGQVARAFDEVHREAVRLAAEQAMLRGNVNAMFTNLSRRSQGLIQRQLSLISELESREADPDQLANLFKLDHLATRMRRNGENLLVLAGEEPGRRWTRPVPLVDVLRAAASEVEQYERIELTSVPAAEVTGRVVNDLVHLLAELLENATSFSSPQTRVRVTGHSLPDGRVLIEIHDTGIGLSPEDLADINERLANPPTVDVSVSRRMGLFVVGRLSLRHGIRIQLRPSDSGGTTALVMLPVDVTQGGAKPAPGGARGGQPAAAAPPAGGAAGAVPAGPGARAARGQVGQSARPALGAAPAAQGRPGGPGAPAAPGGPGAPAAPGAPGQRGNPSWAQDPGRGAGPALPGRPRRGAGQPVSAAGPDADLPRGHEETESAARFEGFDAFGGSGSGSGERTGQHQLPTREPRRPGPEGLPGGAPAGGGDLFSRPGSEPGRATGPFGGGTGQGGPGDLFSRPGERPAGRGEQRPGESTGSFPRPAPADPFGGSPESTGSFPRPAPNEPWGGSPESTGSFPAPAAGDPFGESTGQFAQPGAPEQRDPFARPGAPDGRGESTGQFARPELPAESTGGFPRPELPAESTGSFPRAERPGESTGNVRRPELPAESAAEATAALPAIEAPGLPSRPAPGQGGPGESTGNVPRPAAGATGPAGASVAPGAPGPGFRRSDVFQSPAAPRPQDGQDRPQQGRPAQPAQRGPQQPGRFGEQGRPEQGQPDRNQPRPPAPAAPEPAATSFQAPAQVPAPAPAQPQAPAPAGQQGPPSGLGAPAGPSGLPLDPADPLGLGPVPLAPQRPAAPRAPQPAAGQQSLPPVNEPMALPPAPAREAEPSPEAGAGFSPESSPIFDSLESDWFRIGRAERMQQVRVQQGPEETAPAAAPVAEQPTAAPQAPAPQAAPGGSAPAAPAMPATPGAPAGPAAPAAPSGPARPAPAAPAGATAPQAPAGEDPGGFGTEDPAWAARFGGAPDPGPSLDLPHRRPVASSPAQAAQAARLQAQARAQGAGGVPGAAPGAPGAPGQPRQPAAWRSNPNDEVWQRAEQVREPSAGGVTPSGLPRRVPRANLVPGGATDQAPQGGGGPQVSRSPDDVRGRLTNLRRGIQQGRAAGATDGRGFGTTHQQER
jgi:signal transduction histidine kinase